MYHYFGILDDHQIQNSARYMPATLDNTMLHVGFGAAALANVTVAFLPPDTTSKRQPLDTGIIFAFKKH